MLSLPSELCGNNQPGGKGGPLLTVSVRGSDEEVDGQTPGHKGEPTARMEGPRTP